MVECRIEVITYEQSRLEYFKKLQSRQKKRFEQFEKSSAIKELPPQERHYQLSRMGEVLQYYDDIVKMLEEDITNTPTADVVEVVRCKDCKHFCEYSDSYKSEVEGADGDCFIRVLNSDNHQFNGVKYDDFCSYGERKTT